MKFAYGELRKYAANAAYFPQVGSAATVEQQKETGHPFGCPVLFGAPSGTRTQGPLIKSQLLYQLS